jgi:hypothetical protein
MVCANVVVTCDRERARAVSAAEPVTSNVGASPVDQDLARPSVIKRLLQVFVRNRIGFDPTPNRSIGFISIKSHPRERRFDHSRRLLRMRHDLLGLAAEESGHSGHRDQVLRCAHRIDRVIRSRAHQMTQIGSLRAHSARGRSRSSRRARTTARRTAKKSAADPDGPPEPDARRRHSISGGAS